MTRTTSTILFTYWELIAFYGWRKINAAIVMVQDTFSVSAVKAIALVWLWLDDERPRYSLDNLLNFVPLGWVRLEDERLKLYEPRDSLYQPIPAPLARCPWCHYYNRSGLISCAVHPCGAPSPNCPDFKPSNQNTQ